MKIHRTQISHFSYANLRSLWWSPNVSQSLKLTSTSSTTSWDFSSTWFIRLKGSEDIHLGAPKWDNLYERCLCAGWNFVRAAPRTQVLPSQSFRGCSYSKYFRYELLLFTSTNPIFWTFEIETGKHKAETCSIHVPIAYSNIHINRNFKLQWFLLNFRWFEVVPPTEYPHSPFV